MGEGLRRRPAAPADRRHDTSLDVTLPPLSTVVYRAKKHIPRSKAAPALTVDAKQPYRDRLEVVADVNGSSFYEVTFSAKVGNGQWQNIGTDDNAPYRVFHDVADIEPGTPVQYRAVVLDNADHTRASGVDTATIAPPSIVLEAPNEGQRVRGEVEVRAIATPDHADYEVTFQRSVDGGAFVDRSTDDSSPVYTLFDDTAGLPDGAQVTYRAVLDYGSGEVVSDTRTVTVVQSQVTTAVIHYKRADGNYAPWGLHLFNASSPDAMAPGEATPSWPEATAFEGTDAYGALHSIDLANDTGPDRLHRPREVRRTRTPRTRPAARTGSSCRSPRRRSGSGRATCGSTAARRRTTPAWCRPRSRRDRPRRGALGRRRLAAAPLRPARAAS